MSPPIRDYAHELLARSLPLVQHHKDRIIDRMELHLRGAVGEQEAFGQSEMAAMLLVQLLIDQVRSLVETGQLAAGGGVLDEHKSLGIDGRHYSRFGDALVPILRDELGPNVPREVASAWCDTFWTVVRHRKPLAEAAPA